MAKCKTLIRPVKVQETHAALAQVDDHLGKTDVLVSTWWSGEGFSVIIADGSPGPSPEMEFTWSQYDAIRDAVSAIQKKERKKYKRNVINGFTPQKELA